MTLGQALAFSSWRACLIVLVGVAPTFAWRARAEEALLKRTFGERYALYRRQSSLIVPNLF
jgi:protein-S-isoprenylcysteine O-methyltransferase Ste14